jgi:hypothetical protein
VARVADFRLQPTTAGKTHAAPRLNGTFATGHRSNLALAPSAASRGSRHDEPETEAAAG